MPQTLGRWGLGEGSLRAGVSSLSRSSCQLATRANSTKPNNRGMRSAGMSRVQYQGPLRDRRNQERGNLLEDGLVAW